MPNFMLSGLEPASFDRYRGMSDAELREQGAVRMRADKPDAFPCRVSLECASQGEEVILLNYPHQPAPGSPYRANGPIFVRPSAEQAARYRGDLPSMFLTRNLSLRAYDEAGFIVEAAVSHGSEAAAVIDAMLDRRDVAYVHMHFAGPGCFAARVDRGS